MYALFLDSLLQLKGMNFNLSVEENKFLIKLDFIYFKIELDELKQVRNTHTK